MTQPSSWPLNYGPEVTAAQIAGFGTEKSPHKPPSSKTGQATWFQAWFPLSTKHMDCPYCQACSCQLLRPERGSQMPVTVGRHPVSLPEPSVLPAYPESRLGLGRHSELGSEVLAGLTPLPPGTGR